MLVEVIRKLLELGYLEREELLNNKKLARALIVEDLSNVLDNMKRTYIKIDEYNIYVHATYSTMYVMQHINNLLGLANLSDDSVKLSFID